MSKDLHPTGERGQKRTALVITALASFLTPFVLSAAVIALPSIGKEFQMDVVLLGWVQTSYLLSSAVFLVPFGRIADIKGRKKVFLAGLVIFTVASFAVSLSNSVVSLLISRVVQGFGGSMIFGTAVAILTSVFPPGEGGKALGINVATVYMGIALGPFLGGILIQNFGWRSIFLVNVPLGMIAALLTFYWLKGEWADASGSKFDLAGSILYGVALTSIIWGSLSFSNSGGGTTVAGLPLQTLLALLGGFLCLSLFIAWELRAPSPVLDLRLFRYNRVFTFSSIAALINYSATYAISFFLSLYLQLVKGLDPQIAGTILVAQPVVQALLSPAAGWLSDRIAPRLVASLGIGINAAGLAAFTFIDRGTDILLIIAILVVMGVGFALFSSPNTNAIMCSVERNVLGVASAIVSTMRLLGQVVSMAIAMVILSIFVGTVVLSPANSEPFIAGLRVAFLIFSVLCIIGFFASLTRGKSVTT